MAITRAKKRAQITPQSHTSKSKRVESAPTIGLINGGLSNKLTTLPTTNFLDSTSSELPEFGGFKTAGLFGPDDESASSKSLKHEVGESKSESHVKRASECVLKLEPGKKRDSFGSLTEDQFVKAKRPKSESSLEKDAFVTKQAEFNEEVLSDTSSTIQVQVSHESSVAVSNNTPQASATRSKHDFSRILQDICSRSIATHLSKSDEKTANSELFEQNFGERLVAILTEPMFTSLEHPVWKYILDAIRQDTNAFDNLIALCMQCLYEKFTDCLGSPSDTILEKFSCIESDLPSDWSKARGGYMFLLSERYRDLADDFDEKIVVDTEDKQFGIYCGDTMSEFRSRFALHSRDFKAASNPSKSQLRKVTLVHRAGQFFKSMTVIPFFTTTSVQPISHVDLLVLALVHALLESTGIFYTNSANIDGIMFSAISTILNDRYNNKFAGCLPLNLSWPMSEPPGLAERWTGTQIQHLEEMLNKYESSVFMNEPNQLTHELQEAFKQKGFHCSTWGIARHVVEFCDANEFVVSATYRAGCDPRDILTNGLMTEVALRICTDYAHESRPVIVNRVRQMLSNDGYQFNYPIVDHFVGKNFPLPLREDFDFLDEDSQALDKVKSTPKWTAWKTEHRTFYLEFLQHEIDSYSTPIKFSTFIEQLGQAYNTQFEVFDHSNTAWQNYLTKKLRGPRKSLSDKINKAEIRRLLECCEEEMDSLPRISSSQIVLDKVMMNAMKAMFRNKTKVETARLGYLTKYVDIPLDILAVSYQKAFKLEFANYPNTWPDDKKCKGIIAYALKEGTWNIERQRREFLALNETMEDWYDDYIKKDNDRRNSFFQKASARAD